jgi:hypothetical protein
LGGAGFGEVVNRIVEKYLPRQNSQSENEFSAYRKRASFFNATARTADGDVGLKFRDPPFM